MVKKRAVGNLLGLAVLAYLTRGSMHPYEMSRTLRHNDDGRSIKFNPGSVYMVFEQLTKAGFIVAQETRRDGARPERTIYAITDAGSQELHDWLRDLVEEPQHEFPQFVAALSLIAALPPDEVTELLRRRADRLGEQRAEIRDLIDRTVADGVHPLFLIEEEYRLDLLEADASFVDRFIERITDPRSGWGPQWAELHAQSDTTDERTQS